MHGHERCRDIESIKHGGGAALKSEHTENITILLFQNIHANSYFFLKDAIEYAMNV